MILRNLALIIFFSFLSLDIVKAEFKKYKIFSPNWEELIDYMLPMSASLSELRATTCLTTNQKKKFYATYSSIVIGRSYTWEEYRDQDNYKCIKLYTPNIGFLDENQTRAFLTAHNGHNNKNINWSVRLLIYYYIYRDRFCEIAYDYKPSQTEGYIKRVNICGNERLVQGLFFKEHPILG